QGSRHRRHRKSASIQAGERFAGGDAAVGKISLDIAERPADECEAEGDAYSYRGSRRDRQFCASVRKLRGPEGDAARLAANPGRRPHDLTCSILSCRPQEARCRCGDQSDESHLDTRRELIAEFPLMAQVVAPSTDNDAYIPIHPGAAAFYDGTQQDFFDKYSNALYFGPVVLGGLASLLAALWKFIGANKAIGSPLEPLYALAGEIR